MLEETMKKECNKPEIEVEHINASEELNYNEYEYETELWED